MIVALAGGVGAARMLRGLVAVADPATITAVVNTGDDTVMHGLHISRIWTRSPTPWPG
jgi:LPPG:FO 2-phospho-L-lactate transferase